MKFAITVLTFALTMGSAAFANYELTLQNKEITCDFGNGTTLIVDAKQTVVNSFDGREYLNPNNIESILTDRRTFITFYAGDMTLSFGKSDQYSYRGEPFVPMTCR